MKIQVASLVAAAVIAVSPLAWADDHYKTFDQEAQAALTPDQALQLLKQGNERFVAGESIDRDLIAQQKTTSAGQFPFAVVLSCLDSRSAPEVVFDQGVGDIFVGRVAGNVVDTNLLGTDRSSANTGFVNDVIETNVKMQVNELLRRSDVVRGLVEQGQVKVVGAVHDISTGEVTFL